MPTPLARTLECYDEQYGDIQIATARCAYGDVFRAFPANDGSFGGLLLVDTLEHNEDYGLRMSGFLDGALSQGWGHATDAETDVVNLGRWLQSQEDPQTGLEASTFQYVKGRRETLALCNGGMPYPVLVHGGAAPSVDRIQIFGFYIDSWSEHHSPPYQFVLQPGDALVLRTDGFDEGLIRYRRSMGVPSTTEQLLCDLLSDGLREPVKRTAAEIRDILVDRLTTMVLPRNREDDDVTLAVLMRTR
jgi:hypothetical protein